MNVDETPQIVQTARETEVEFHAVADSAARLPPLACHSPEHDVVDTLTDELVANCASVSSSLPLNPSCEVIMTSPQRCSPPPVDTAPSTSSQHDAISTTSITGTSRVVLLNGRAISVTSDDTQLTQPPILAGCSRPPRLRRAATRVGMIAPSSPTQKNGAPAATAISGSEADFKLHSCSAAERRQSGWARLRRWRSHRERTVDWRSPYCTPPQHWSPLHCTLFLITNSY